MEHSFDGTLIWDEGRWLGELPDLMISAQGVSQFDVYSQLIEIVESLSGKPGFKVFIHPEDDNVFKVTASDMDMLMALAKLDS